MRKVIIKKVTGGHKEMFQYNTLALVSLSCLTPPSLVTLFRHHLTHFRHLIPLFSPPFYLLSSTSNLIYSRSVCASKRSLVYMPLHLYFHLAFHILPFINLFLPLSHYTSLSSFHFLLLSLNQLLALSHFFSHLLMRL